MRKTQQGFTLIELMISVTLGIFLVAGALNVFSSTVSSGSRSMSMTRLNQDLQAILDVMGNEIKRAGFIQNSNNVTTSSIISVPSSTCLLYEYDTVRDGNIGNEDKRGFRYNSTDKTVEFRESSTGSCTGSNTSWRALNDKRTVTVTATNITLSSSCFNLTQHKTDGTTCGTANTGDYLLTSYVINVSLTGQAANDADTARTVNGSYNMRTSKYTKK